MYSLLPLFKGTSMETNEQITYSRQDHVQLKWWWKWEADVGGKRKRRWSRKDGKELLQETLYDLGWNSRSSRYKRNDCHSGLNSSLELLKEHFRIGAANFFNKNTKVITIQSIWCVVGVTEQELPSCMRLHPELYHVLRTEFTKWSLIGQVISNVRPHVLKLLNMSRLNLIKMMQI